jgi:ureidoacrylate peracid hydrolase
MQNDYCHPDGVFARAGLRIADLPALVASVNRLVSAARSATVPVIWVRMEWPDDHSVGLLARRSPFLQHEGLRAGSWGAQLVDGLQVDAADRVVVKERFSAFHRTELEDVLQAMGASSLAVAGVRTDFCIESTVRDGFFRDLRMIVATDAVAGYFEDMHLASLRLMGTVFAEVCLSTEAIALAIRGA